MVSHTPLQQSLETPTSRAYHGKSLKGDSKGGGQITCPYRLWMRWSSPVAIELRCRHQRVRSRQGRDVLVGDQGAAALHRFCLMIGNQALPTPPCSPRELFLPQTPHQKTQASTPQVAQIPQPERFSARPHGSSQTADRGQEKSAAKLILGVTPPHPPSRQWQPSSTTRDPKHRRRLGQPHQPVRFCQGLISPQTGLGNLTWRWGPTLSVLSMIGAVLLHDGQASSVAADSYS